MKLNKAFFLLLFLVFFTGCNQHVMMRPEVQSLPSFNRIHTVILVSSQGSQPGFPGGSQFVDYMIYNYSTHVNFIAEPLMSVGIDRPRDERLNEIADDIVKAIKAKDQDVGVWAYSLGADSMFFISERVKKKLGSTNRMHVLLIDPMILDNPCGRALVGLHAFLGMPIARFLQKADSYIKEHQDEWLNLSGGTVFNFDFDWRFINVDRHYPWTGQSLRQRKVLDCIDARCEQELKKLDVDDK